MAYLRPVIREKCFAHGCGRYATVRLIDRWNGERGFFCARHGKKACEEQARHEAGNDGRVR